LTRGIRVFHRSKAGDGGSFVKTVDLGVMSYRKYKALRDNETNLEAYVGCYVDCGEGYAEFVAFYLNEIKEQGDSR